MMKYTEQNPHPDLKYIETKAWRTSEGGTIVKTVWFQCQKCKTYQHSLQHFGWECANCQLKKKVGKEEVYQ